MGTWAEGNFDNDGALDYVGGIIDGLAARIEECFATEGGTDLDEDGEAVLVPSVEIISLLCQHCNAAPPKAEVVANWKSKFLAVFDEEFGNLEPIEGFEQKRRQVIEATFDTLEKQAREFWSED